MDRRERAALLGAGMDVVLVLWKLTLATASGSLALLADAAHSAADIVVSLSVFLGFRMQRRAVGWRRDLENAVALLVGCAIMATALALIREALAARESRVGRIGLALAGTMISVSISYFVSRFKIHVGRETDSPSLTADGLHNRADMFSSVAVVVGLLGSAMGIQLDRAAAVVVGVLVSLMGLRIIRSSLRGLRRGKSLSAALYGNSRREDGTYRISSLPGRILAVSVGGVGSFLRHYGRPIVVVVLVFAVLIYARSGVTQIQMGEHGVVLRFGRARQQVLEPGLHLLWPWPVERVLRIRDQEVRRVEVGFRIRSQQSASLLEPEALLWETTHLGSRYVKIPEEAILLTGDEYLVDCSACVQYTVNAPRRYLFGVVDPDELIRAATEEALRKLAATVPMTDLLVARRVDLERRIRSSLEDSLELYRMGIRIERVLLIDVHPPVEVVEAYRDVSSAREDRVRAINNAEAYRNQSVHQAEAQRAESISLAQGDRSERIRAARGEAARFRKLAAAVREGGELALWRLQLESLEKTLKDAEIYLVPSEEDVGSLDLRFYDRAPRAPE